MFSNRIQSGNLHLILDSMIRCARAQGKTNKSFGIQRNNQIESKFSQFYIGYFGTLSLCSANSVSLFVLFCIFQIVYYEWNFYFYHRSWHLCQIKHGFRGYKILFIQTHTTQKSPSNLERYLCTYGSRLSKNKKTKRLVNFISLGLF